MNLLEVTEPRNLLSIPQAQHLLGGVSRKTIYRLIDRGDLTRVKIGSRSMVTAKSMIGLVDRAAAS